MVLFKTPFGEVRAHAGWIFLAFDASNGRRAAFDVALPPSQVTQPCGARRFARESSTVGAESRGNMIGGLFMRRTANCHSRCQEHTGAGGKAFLEGKLSNESG